jgi:c(7)-type cytochrome triheme protein
MLVAALAITLVAGAAMAQNMPKLPPDRALARSGDSPGPVVFSHQNHVGFQAKPDCTACHPRLAPILAAKRPGRRAPVTHKMMEKGQACGACHNGTAAHGFDDCTTCHKS